MRTFQQGSSVPGNLVYFKVLVDDPGPLSLKTADGKDIPASIRMIGPDRVFAPIDPIAPDTIVVLTFPSDSCGHNPPNVNFVFQTRAPLEPNLQPAQLMSGSYGLISGLGYQSNSGVSLDPIAFQRLYYEMLDSAAATLHLLDIDAKLDGQLFSTGAEIVELHAVCSGPVPAIAGACGPVLFSSGRHTVTAQPHIVGYPDPPPSSLDIDFDRACGVCAAAATSASAGAGSGGSAGAGGTTAAVNPDAGVSLDAGPATTSAAGASAISAPAPAPHAASAAASGCNAAGHSGGGAAPWLVALALAGLRRRKR